MKCKITQLNSIVLLCFVFILSSCVKEDAPPIASRIAIINGTSQTAIVEKVLPEAIEVMVQDQHGMPFSGHPVYFKTEDGEISETETISNEEGIVTINWVLGPMEGIQNLEIISYQLDGITALRDADISISAVASAEPLIPTSIELIKGDNQETKINTLAPEAIEIMVKDQNGNAFKGALIHFAVEEGKITTEEIVTGESGKANVAWELGKTIGTQNIAISAYNSETDEHISGSPFAVEITALKPLLVGEYHQGGIIFYVDDLGEHGFVCAVKDQSEGIKSGCLGSKVNGATGSAVGTGSKNTEALMESCTHNSDDDDNDMHDSAAGICVDLVSNGYSDWFLPSRDELIHMGNNRAKIDETALGNNGEIFVDGAYWSSTEFDDNRAWYQVIGYDQENYILKNYSARVRAVRAF